MPLGFEQLHPEGMIENSPAFQRRDRRSGRASPEGTAEIELAQPSLRDSPSHETKPGVETPGYFHAVPSGHIPYRGPEILVALGFQTCCPVRRSLGEGGIADFRVGCASSIVAPAGLETGDTADLEVCATQNCYEQRTITL